MNEGDVLAGKYRVDKVLGVGGMGVVVAAHHLQLDEKVALKFLLPEMLSNAEAVARFEREARAAVKIKSEHVARVSDVGKLENGAPYMVMEYLDGGDLAAWVQQRGALPVEQAVELVLQACEALAEAHALGIVHRDLKPANLFCIRRADGLLSIKVLDFGISKVTALGGSGPDMSMTKTQALMGSPLYMSPEQMQSAKNADMRADLWALGVILYELLTGQVPFNGEVLPELVLKVVSAPPAPMRSLRPDLPDGLEAVVLRCLEKDRERRFANVAELAVALAEFGPRRARGSVERASRVLQAAGLSASALALPPSSEAGAAVGRAAGTVGSWAQTAPGGGRGKVFAGAIGAAVIAGALAVVVLVLLRRSPDTSVNAAAGASAAGLVGSADAPVVPATVTPPPAELAPSASASAAPPPAETHSPTPPSTPPSKPVARTTAKHAPPGAPAAAPPKPTPTTPQSPATAAPKYDPTDHL
ncbi:MAG: serine/threonine-protein kinase [Sorangiineae bacterium]|nr:serine/threonine-protein kinase [Polyangiaceae bacterium]MEB2320964.1 serine/threonine-protein kinase [Sorangiineae bacterium]